ncbi:Autoinducer 2 import system permease protein LsrD [Planctomycetes bacterium Pan216]|uniref:Autoinducer 2 import system permease protein LsrD n=1 Tax=Kolteria novifilia TaxID=2527975 RepID=A0A518AWX0_9BACT|nr:Autoinducer 2 import system permease protein LsrD [Planctomycetes bacterium Pan216]
MRTAWLSTATRLLPVAILGLMVWLVFRYAARPSYVPQLWRPWAEIGMLALAMTPVILIGGIDLSIGSIVALSGVVIGVLWRDAQLVWPIAVLGGVLTGFLAGSFNGVLALVGIAPLVATLATMALYAGIALALCGVQPVSGMPAGFTILGQGSLGVIPLQLFYFAIATIIFYVLVHHTVFGRYLYAMGDNRLAARFAAVPVRGMEWAVYALSGTMAGLVAVAYTARGGGIRADTTQGMELVVIACVVLGGTRVTGGAGGIPRTLLGIAIIANLEIALGFLGGTRLTLPGLNVSFAIDAHSRQVVIGVLMVGLAIWNERLSQRRLS